MPRSRWKRFSRFPTLGLISCLVFPLPAAAESPSLDLEKALSAAARTSPELRARRAEVDEARGRLLTARTFPFNPRLEVEAGRRRSPEATTTDRGLRLSQELELGGQRGRRRAVAEARLAGAEARLLRQGRRLAARVELAFAEAVRARDLGRPGKSLGVVLEGQKRFGLQARFAPRVRRDLDGIRDLRVVGPPGPDGGPRLIPLSQLAEITVEDGPAQISRDQISRRISVEANVRGRDLASFVAEAREAVERKVDLPPGWTVEWGGQFQNLRQATARLATLIPLALLMIFVLLHSTFGSARLGAMIFLNIPIAATGGVFALLVRGYPFSISAGVGFIALAGVATMNGLVLASHVEGLRRQGLSLEEALVRGASEKMRAMILAPLVAGLGFLPMALATSAGAEVQRPLATVVIGGLVTSTLLTLFVLPAIYGWFAERREAR